MGMAVMGIIRMVIKVLSDTNYFLEKFNNFSVSMLRILAELGIS